MIVVIVVLAILAGTISVSVQDVNENTRLSNAATRALADVRYAAEMAMTHRREVEVTVQKGSNKYDIRWADTGTYLPSPIDGEDLIVQFNTGEYQDVEMTSTGLSGKLSFRADGEPRIGGGRFGSERSVFCLNEEIHVVAYSSGYVVLEKVVGGGGCGC